MASDQINWDKYYLRQVLNLAEIFSKSIRLKVGAILVKDNRPLANGYNGTPEGWDNQCEDITARGPWTDKTEYLDLKDYYSLIDSGKKKQDDFVLVTKSEVSHAEENLIGYCAREGISTKDCTIYITDSPCMPCCRLLRRAGIRRIVYIREYRDNTAIEFCAKAGIKLEQISLEG